MWPRLLHAAEQSHTAVIVLAPQRVAGSFSTLSLGVRARAAAWQPGAWPLFDGIDSLVEVTRNKLGVSEQQVVIRVRDRVR